MDIELWKRNADSILAVLRQVAEQPQIINKACEDAHMPAKDRKQMWKFCREPNKYVL